MAIFSHTLIEHRGKPVIEDRWVPSGDGGFTGLNRFGFMTACVCLTLFGKLVRKTQLFTFPYPSKTACLIRVGPYKCRPYVAHGLHGFAYGLL